MPYSWHLAVAPFFQLFLQMVRGFGRDFSHALLTHSHELTHITLLSLSSSLSLAQRLLILSSSLPEGLSEAATHDSHSPLPLSSSAHRHAQTHTLSHQVLNSTLSHMHSSHTEIRHDTAAHTPQHRTVSTINTTCTFSQTLCHIFLT